MVVGTDWGSHDLLLFAGHFLALRSGAAVVSSARAEVRTDEQEPYVLLSLALGPPPPGRETWPTEDMFKLRQEVRRRLAERGVPGVVVTYVGGEAEGETEPELINGHEGKPVFDEGPSA